MFWWIVAGLALGAPGPTHAAVSIQIGKNFRGAVEGIDANAVPADANGAVGTNHFVEFVNGRFSVYLKATAQRVQTKSDDEFWQDSGITFPAGVSVSDPRAIYDAASGRWFVAAVDVNLAVDPPTGNRFLLAVSKNEDPTDTWSGVALATDPTRGSFGDFPTLGLDANGVYLSADLFSRAGRALGPTLISIPKADLLEFPPKLDRQHSFGVLTYSARGEIMQPAVTTGNPTTGGVALAIASRGADFNAHSNIFLTHIPNPKVVPAGQLTSAIVTAIPAYTVPINPSQPDGTDNLDNGDARIGAMVRRVGDTLYAVHGVQVDNRAALQWFVVDALTGGLVQSGIINDPSLQYYYPSVAANEAGVVVISFNGSSTNQFISSFAVAGHGPPGKLVFGPPVLLKAGLVSYQEPDETGISRWGDYSATCVDPVDSNRFWTIQLIPGSKRAWATQITEIITAPLRLRIVVSGENLRITWPDAPGLRLQSTASLGLNAVWTSLSELPIIENGNSSFLVSSASPKQFYRLVQE